MIAVVESAIVAENVATNLAWALGYLGLAILASVGYRLARGKPVLFFSVANAQFIEWMASGRAQGPSWRPPSAADLCLVVAIAGDRLVVRPFFPFTLLFLPELMGVELDVPLERVSLVTVERGLFRTWVRLAYLTKDGERRKLSLALDRPDEFSRLLPARAA